MKTLQLEVKETTLEIFVEVIRIDFAKFLKEQNDEFYRELIKRLEREIK